MASQSKTKAELESELAMKNAEIQGLHERLQIYLEGGARQQAEIASLNTQLKEYHGLYDLLKRSLNAHLEEREAAKQEADRRF